MKHLLLTLSAVALSAGLAPAGPAATRAAVFAPAPISDEQLFAGLSQQVTTAMERRDIAALDKLLTPEFVDYNMMGTVTSRAEFLAQLGVWSGATIKLVGPLKVVRRGDLAAAIATYAFNVQAQGQTAAFTVQVMAAWELRGGRWQMAFIQSKELKA